MKQAVHRNPVGVPATPQQHCLWPVSRTFCRKCPQSAGSSRTHHVGLVMSNCCQIVEVFQCQFRFLLYMSFPVLVNKKQIVFLIPLDTIDAEIKTESQNHSGSGPSSVSNCNQTVRNSLNWMQRLPKLLSKKCNWSWNDPCCSRHIADGFQEFFGQQRHMWFTYSTWQKCHCHLEFCLKCSMTNQIQALSW